jgi:hypothetical protein
MKDKIKELKVIPKMKPAKKNENFAVDVAEMLLLKKIVTLQNRLDLIKKK